MMIATWNVNSLKVRLPHVLDWLADKAPDLVALQETKVQDENFPVAELAAAGWQAVYSGQKTYNGVAILSRPGAGPRDVVVDLPTFDDHQRRVLAATYGDLRLVNLYVPNGSEVGSDKYAYKLQWLEHLREWLAEELAAHPLLAVVGDFNVAPEDRDVHDPEAWEGSVLVSPAERAAFRAILALGLHDAFRLFQQEGGHYSWWDYRAAAFRRNRGLRIDHILVSDALRARCRECAIDTAPRGWERPSDHAPVYAVFED